MDFIKEIEDCTDKLNKKLDTYEKTLGGSDANKASMIDIIRGKIKWLKDRAKEVQTLSPGTREKFRADADAIKRDIENLPKTKTGEAF